MLLKDQAIVFRTHKYGESSLIVELYTQQKGVRKYIINGVRSPKARTKANLLQVMTLLDIVAYERDDKDINRLKELRPSYIYQSIPFDIRKGTVGLFMIEVARKAIKEKEENTPLFNFLSNTFRLLDTSPHSIAHFHLVFLLELSTFLGFQPAGSYSDETSIFNLMEGEYVATSPDHGHYLSGNLSIALDQLLDHNTGNCHELKLERELRKRLLEQLVFYYQLHLDGLGVIHSHQILKEVF